MDSTKILAANGIDGTSQVVYGDSDADENPFEHPSAHGVKAFASAYSGRFPNSNATISGVEPEHRFSSSGIANGSSSSSISMRSMQQDSWLQVSHTHGDINLPTIIGHSSPFLNGDLRPGPTAASVDMEVTEVETENESGGEEALAYPAYGVTVGDGATPTTAEWSTIEEKEWVRCIDHELRNANAGKTDAHAMRYLLRKAGFVPGSLRKDVWRLLILGRVGVGAGGGNANGSGVAQREMLALDAAILSTELDLDNQRVVRVDVERTRTTLEQFKRPRVKNMLARLLTHHCKKHGVGYKQGMHEVLAPFVALSDPELPTSEISLCYGAFIKRFLPYAFNKDEEFLSLQICFRLFRILLLYHHPRLCRFLDQYQLQPELYATPWFLTLFASSLDLPRLYEVWDSYLYWGDPALHHFVVLAFVMGNADVILQAEEANLPEIMCRLSVGMRSVEEVRGLVRTAKDLMLNTPKSFRKILRSALYTNLSQSQMNLVLNTLQVSSCIPVSAEEVISYILHKNPHRQLDQESDQEDSSVSEENKMSSMEPSSLQPREGVDTADRNVRPSSPRRVAERAAMRSLRVHRQYIILDCRPREEFEACRLAPALHLDPELLDSPDDLDAKLKEFNPLQGVAHFCLVGAGGDAGADWQRKHVIPSDLSGEAMGILPTSTSKGDHSARRGASPIRRGSSRSERDWDAGGEKDGGFNWMGGFSKALAARVHGSGGVREGEEEVGKEEDVQVARFVLMLLQYNFPYISHVRGNMAACLKELSTQALEEMGDEGIPDGDYQETLHGLLIGSDADRMREEMTRCSPEKVKSEGLLAGLAKWTMDKSDWKDSSTNEAGTEGVDGIARIPSWISRDIQLGDRGDVSGKTKRSTEVEAAKPQDQPKTPKRRLFGGVLNRFDKFDAAVVHGNKSGSGDSEEAETEIVEIIESTSPRSGPTTSPGMRRLLRTVNARTRSPPKAESAAVEEEEKGEAKAGAGAGPSAGDERDGSSSRGTVQGSNSIIGKKKPTGTWVKPSKVGAPDRLARFLGKVLGVRDDALPDETLPINGGHCRSHDTVVETAEEETKEAGEVRTREGSGGQSAMTDMGVEVEESTPRSEESGAWSNRNRTAATASGTASTNDTVTPIRNDTTAREVTAVADVSSISGATVTATAVYPGTTAMADALPVAVAVAIPVTDGGAVVPDPARPARRPSRNRGGRAAGGGASSGAGGTPGRRAGEQAAAPAVGETVLISQWVAREERESGGRVKVFSAQRVLEGKSQKKCRLVVSPKNMVQFDNVRDSDGGARGVISEHRGLRHLARITSRKKHADLIVFHFKSRSGHGTNAAATGSSSRYGASSGETTSGGTSNSRRFRIRSTSENGPGQPDVLFYFMREHAECLRMVKENYRKITQGSSGGGSVSGTSNRSTVTPSSGASSEPSRGGGASSAQDSRQASSQSPVEEHPNRSGRRAAKAAGAVAGATGLVVGATAGVAVGAAAGVAAGAAYLVGHRRGAKSELKARSTSPSRERRRGGGGNVSATVGRRRDSGAWIPIDAPGGWIPIDMQVEARRRADANGAGRGGAGYGRSSPAAGVRRSNLSSTQNGSSRGQSRTSRGKGVTNGPTWLSR